MNDRYSRKNNALKLKNVKLLTKGYSDPYQSLTTGFDSIRLELENENLRQMIEMLEGKNKVLEEHCSLLREKNLYAETRLRDTHGQLRDLKDLQSGDISEQNNEKEVVTGEDKSTSLVDRISGVVFGVALPKLGKVFGMIREKGQEMRSFVEEQGGSEEMRRHCPLTGGSGDFQQRLHALKVNLFRVAVVLGSLVVLSGVGYAGYKIWKTRYRHPSYLIHSEDEEEEDSGEELFRAPGTSGTSNSIVKNNSTDSFETPGISTDFRSILDTANKK